MTRRKLSLASPTTQKFFKGGRSQRLSNSGSYDFRKSCYNNKKLSRNCINEPISKSIYFLAFVLALIGVLTFLSILAHVMGYRGVFSGPGRFLFSSFVWTSLFVPVYLIVLAFFLVYRPFRVRIVVILNLFVLPFVTASLLQKVVLAGRLPPSYLPEQMMRTMGRFPSALLLFLLLLLELVLIFKVKRLAVESTAVKRLAAAPPAVNLAKGKYHQDEEIEDLVPVETRLLDSPVIDSPVIDSPIIDSPVIDSPVSSSTTTERRINRPPVQPEVSPAEPIIEDAEFEAVGGEKKAPLPTQHYSMPVHGLLKDYEDGPYWEIDAETRRSGEVLMSTLKEFRIQAEVTGIRKGPVITMFEILPAPGVKISRIVNLADNIALRLAASRVRIVAPIPGKHAVGIEVPNAKRAIVSFKEMVSIDQFQKSKFEIPIALGKDIAGDAQIVDLTQTPHLLIAGATGSGKSVCVNSIICSVLYKKSPEEVRVLLIDPKIVELKAYNDIPHLLTPVVTDPRKSFQALQYCLVEMERRYSLLDALGVRDVHSYNRKAQRAKVTIKRIPYWVVVIDEFADLIATTGKEMEATLARLAAMARAVGIHLVLATQRPSIDVITGLIKANIPSRIAFMVAGKFDSRIIIDAVGAEKLLGQGDMLFSAAWDPVPVRVQGAFLSEDEVEAITDHARSLGKPDYMDEEMFFDEEEETSGPLYGEDPLMDKALEIILAAGKASASYLQRRLKIGYNRAARLVEEMEMRGIVGPANGSKPREILHVPDRKPSGL